MCELCESQNSSYALQHQFVKARDTYKNGNVSAMPLPVFVAFVMMCKSKAGTLLENVSNKKSVMISHSDVVYLMMTAENLAIEFTQQHLGKIHLEKDAAIAKEIENFRAALTLIQSKAILSGDATIEKIAKDALDNQEFKFGQSAQELKSMLDDNQ